MGFISRQIDKMYKGVLFRRHDPDGSIFYFSADDFPELASEEFSFVSKRGHKLYGSFYYYEKPKANRLIIFEHGMGNGHGSYFCEIERLARAGYLVYSYDHTGCNRSEGEHIYGLSGSLSDLDDCIKALVNERGFLKSQISIVGHSWGGFSTLNILSLHQEIRSIVAVSGFISIPVMQREAVPSIFYPFLPRLLRLEQQTNPVFADSSGEKVLSSTDRPVLVIHSTDDGTVSYKSNFSVLESALKGKENIDFLTVSGSGHNPFFTRDAFKYKEEFFKDLKKMRGRKKLVTDDQKAEFVSRYDWRRMTAQNEDVWSKIIEHLEK